MCENRDYVAPDNITTVLYTPQFWAAKLVIYNNIIT